MATCCTRCGKRLPFLRSLDYTSCSTCDPRSGTTSAGAGWSWGTGDLFLGFGQLVSVLGCVAAPVYAIAGLAAAPKPPPGAPSPSVWVVVGAAAGFGYSAAMFVVFSRVSRLSPTNTDAEPAAAPDAGR